MWKIWSRDTKINDPANVDKFCATNDSVTEETEPEF